MMVVVIIRWLYLFEFDPRLAVLIVWWKALGLMNLNNIWYNKLISLNLTTVVNPCRTNILFRARVFLPIVYFKRHYVNASHYCGRVHVWENGGCYL